MTSDELLIKNLVRDYGVDLTNAALNMSRLRTAINCMMETTNEVDRRRYFEKAARAIAEVGGYLPFETPKFVDALNRIENLIDERMLEAAAKVRRK